MNTVHGAPSSPYLPAALLSLGFVFAAGCEATTDDPPPAAPTELSDLTLFLFAEFDSDDDALIADGFGNLDEFLLEFHASTGLGVDVDKTERSWEPPILQGDDLDGLPQPEGVDPADQLPMSLGFLSTFGMDAHLPIVGLLDQTPVEPASSEEYDRTFLTDVDCFLDRSCDVLETSNAVRRKNFLLDVPYTLRKDFRHRALPDGGRVVAARYWLTDRAVGDSGANSIDQSYGMNIWIEHPDGAIRYDTLWSSATIPAVTDDNILINLIRSGMDEHFENTEAYLATQ